VGDFYSNMANTAKVMIAKFGKTMVLRTVVRSGTEWSPTQTDTDTEITGVVTLYKTSEIDGTVIKQNDKQVLLDSTVAPVKDGKIVDGSDVYQIVDFETLSPASTVVLYKVQVRK